MVTAFPVTMEPAAVVKVVAALLLCSVVISESQVTFQDKSDYCQLESFNVSCGEGEIIMLVSALYGRMRAGRCITRSYGNLGCSANVLSYMDTRCSGRKSCLVPIPDPNLHRTQPCPKDFTTYLEVEYQCIKVASSPGAVCEGDPRPRPLEAGEGYLAGSVVSAHPGGGVGGGGGDGGGGMPASTVGMAGLGGQPSCKYTIKAQPGQLINISLVNFNSSSRGSVPYISSSKIRTDGSSTSSSSSSSTSSSSHHHHHRGPCIEVATIVDGDIREPLQLCRRQRLVTAYVSRSHEITVNLAHTPSSHGAAMFLLKYKAVGCPDVKANAGLWVRRTRDTAMVRCNLTEETWYLSCEGDEWKGRVGNCSQAAKKWNMDEAAISEEPVPYGILITVAIGAALGIFLGGVLLAIVLLIRRYRMTPREPPEVDYQIRENLPRKTYDIDKGYAPVLDERGHFPISAERFPVPVAIPRCPDPATLTTTAASTTSAPSGTLTTTITQLPVDITQGTLPRDVGGLRIEAPIFCSHPECHVYESTRLGLANQNKRTS